MSDAILSVAHLSKTFYGQAALDNASLDVEAGKVMALVGHNGSGKSTLTKILAGYHVPDHDPRTRVVVGDEELRFGQPQESRRLGLRFLHQDLGLVPGLTVLENLQLGRPWETTATGKIRWRNVRARAREAIERVGLDVDVESEVERLGPIQRTQLAAARALSDDQTARVVVLDEPTAVLPANEVEGLFELVRNLTKQGVGVIYVSHRLEEIPTIADDVTVLRDGEVVGEGPTEAFPRERLVRLIVGEDHEVAPMSSATANALSHADARLRFESVTTRTLRDASFAVHAGEVLGIAGLTGSGIDDVVPALQGRLPVEGGRITSGVGDSMCVGPIRLARSSIAVLPAERELRSVITMSVRENLTLPDISRFWQGLRLRMGLERTEARSLIDRFNILPRQIEAELRDLSGGNQQKVNLARRLNLKPSVLVLAEPTQGVDVGGKDEVLSFVRDAAQLGMAVLICSSDVYELEAVCSRVVVIRRGRVAVELVGADILASRISRECYGLELAF